jgi:cGMP-dependent protein kinase
LKNIEKIEKPHDTANQGILETMHSRNTSYWPVSAIKRKQGIVEKMFLLHCEERRGIYFFRQGDQASCFFIIHEGEVVVEVNSKVKKTLPQGEGFGELALLYNAPRSASIKAASPQLHCWGYR